MLAERKMSQKALADAVGVKPQSVFEWKTKGNIPRADTAIKIAEYFNVPIKWLVLGVEDAAFTQDERDLLAVYRQLDQRDKDDLLGIADMKLENSKKGDILSNTANA